jgi:FtsP/CotA-like multicopper oxidase with cupredoxin domain
MNETTIYVPVSGAQPEEDALHTVRTRREILRGGVAVAAGIAAVGLTGCATQAQSGFLGAQSASLAQAAPPTPAPTDAMAHEAAPASSASGASDWEEMDRMHEAGIKAFPAKTEGLGGQPLAPTMDGDVKVFNLTCSRIEWQSTPAMTSEAWAYNGTVPGPEIRVTEGDKVRVVVKNELEESTSVHFHGLIVPNNMDGVPYITQPPIKPGETFTYEFVVKNSGSHMYHSHHNAAKQVTKGLLGAFIVEPKDRSQDPAYDHDYTLVLNDAGQGFTLNGKGFPATQPLTAKLGEKIRIRYMNEGLVIHPMHLHGMPQLVFAKDGWNLPQPFKCDTINVAPGERWDVIVDCTEAGVWAFHCHILTHAESDHGMFGMVTALIVEA